MSSSLRANGFTVAFCKGTDMKYVLHRDCHDGLREAWMAGRSFHEVQDLYGDPLTIRLGDISAVGLCTPEGLARYEEEEQELKIRGDLE